MVVQERVLSALKDAGVFTSGGLISDKVGYLFLLMASLVETPVLKWNYGHISLSYIVILLMYYFIFEVIAQCIIFINGYML